MFYTFGPIFLVSGISPIGFDNILPANLISETCEYGGVTTTESNGAKNMSCEMITQVVNKPPGIDVL